jgi:molybdate transport system substrate-binding protein
MINKSMVYAIAAAISSVLLVAIPGSIVNAAEIKVLSVGALNSLTKELIPTFEKSTGHKVTIESGAAGAMANRIQKDEVVDVGIVTTVLIERLVTQGKVMAGTQVIVAKAGMGISARKGISKLDIGSIDAFKRTLIAAKSIGHTDPASGASSAIYAAKLLAGLDIAAELKPKIKTFASNALLHEAIAKGDVELGFGQKTEILADAHLEFIGPLPAPVQNISQFSAGVVASTKEPDAAKAFINFLTSPVAAAVMKEKGFE